MQIDRILYPVTTLGPGKRVAIWTIGCPRRCKNCSNPELWDSNPSKDIDVDDIIEFIKRLDGDIEGITITGGEPFMQAEDLRLLLIRLRENGYKDILVYTGHEYDDLRRQYPKTIEQVDVVITGEYVDELNDNKGIRGSSNQRMIIINNSLIKKYSGFDTCTRMSQNFLLGGKVVSVGIPIHVDE